MNGLLIFENIQRRVSLTEAEKEHFDSFLTAKALRKKDLVLTQGQRCKKLYFVEEGSLRAYHINEKGKESTVMFAINDWWITDMNCFVNQTPALLSIEALEHSKVLALDFDSLESLYEQLPKLERFFRILFQNAYIREQQRALQKLSSNVEEQYLQFVKSYPTIVEKVTQKQIASYLGVTPEFLSSIKKKSLKLS